MCARLRYRSWGTSRKGVLFGTQLYKRIIEGGRIPRLNVYDVVIDLSRDVEDILSYHSNVLTEYEFHSTKDLS